MYVLSLLANFTLGCSRKNLHPPDGWDSGNSRGRGGQILWKSRREGGLNLKKSSAGVILTDNSRDSNVKFSDSSSLSDPENSTNILFRYFSPDKNDNLSSFAGPFIAENANIKILKNEQRGSSNVVMLQRRVWNAWHISTRTQTQRATVV